jgi:hypothetical protein
MFGGKNCKIGIAELFFLLWSVDKHLRMGTSPVGGAVGCSAHTLGSRLTRRRFSSSEFISKKIPSTVKSGFGVF